MGLTMSLDCFNLDIHWFKWRVLKCDCHLDYLRVRWKPPEYEVWCVEMLSGLVGISRYLWYKAPEISLGVIWESLMGLDTFEDMTASWYISAVEPVMPYQKG